MNSVLTNKKGTSLIELVIAMTIFTILAACISLLMLPTLQEYHQAIELAQVNSIIDNVANEITSDLSLATEEPNIATDHLINIQKANMKVSYSCQGNSKSKSILVKSYNDGEKSPVFDQAYYRNKGIVVSYAQDERIYSVKVSLYNEKGDIIIDRKFVVKPILLN